MLQAERGGELQDEASAAAAASTDRPPDPGRHDVTIGRQQQTVRLRMPPYLVCQGSKMRVHLLDPQGVREGGGPADVLSRRSGLDRRARWLQRVLCQRVSPLLTYLRHGRGYC